MSTTSPPQAVRARASNSTVACGWTSAERDPSNRKTVLETRNLTWVSTSAVILSVAVWVWAQTSVAFSEKIVTSRSGTLRGESIRDPRSGATTGERCVPRVARIMPGTIGTQQERISSMTSSNGARKTESYEVGGNPTLSARRAPKSAPASLREATTDLFGIG